MIQCENTVSPTSNHTGMLGQVRFRSQLEPTTPAKIRTKYGIKIGKAQKWDTIYDRNLKYIKVKTKARKSSKNSCHKFSVNEHKLVTQLVFELKSMASWKGSPL